MIKQGTAYTHVFVLVDATDDETGEVIATPASNITVYISKNGGAFAAPNDGTIAAIDDSAIAGAQGEGWYTIDLDATDTALGLSAGESGEIAVLAWAAGTNIWRSTIEVYAAEDATLSSGTLTDIADEVAATTPTWTTAARFNKIADYILRRAFSSAEASSDGDTLQKQSLIGAAAKDVNRIELDGGTLTIYKTDGTTTFYTQSATTDPDAQGVTSLQ